jgi:hypothetical protein
LTVSSLSVVFARCVSHDDIATVGVVYEQQGRRELART